MTMTLIDTEKPSNCGGVAALCVSMAYGFYSTFSKFCHAIGFPKKFDPLSRCFFCIFSDGTPLKIGYMVVFRVAVDVINNGKVAWIFYKSYSNEPMDKFWLFFTATVGKPNSQMTASMGLLLEMYPSTVFNPAVYANRSFAGDTVDAAKITDQIPSFVPHNIAPLLLHSKP